MKKILYLAFIAAVALSVGCHTAWYPVITDTDGSSTFVVNTNGNATLWASYEGHAATGFGGRWYELYTGVDQGFSGDRVFTTYAVTAPIDVTFQFIDWTYCTPDKGGCWVAKSPQSAASVGNWDYTYNASCKAIGALSLLLYYNARIGECGRLFGQKLSLMDRVEMLNGMLTPGVIAGMDATLIRATRSNTRVAMSDANTGEFVGFLPLSGVYTFGFTQGRTVAVLTANMKHTMKSMARMGADRDLSIDLTFNGVTVPGIPLKVLPDQLLKNASKI